MNKFDWHSYGVSMIPFRVLEAQRRHNAIVNGCLAMMRRGIGPPVTRDDLDWWEWLEANPVRRMRRP